MEWFNIFSLFSPLLVNPLEPIRVSGGLLQGRLSFDGTYMSYSGVPYATVVTRFQDAVPYPKWTGIKQADNENIQCPQSSSLSSSLVQGQEDCLVLNVYAPVNVTENLRSVMVYFHGGGFRSGSGSSLLYGPEYYMRHDIVLVTVNYRLAILGYLCLGIKEAPGNVGLKDQVLALKWVQENIKFFGGDPDRVTIFGESAGAASVSYHVLSPMSKGLFSKAIMQSATAFSPFSFQYDPVDIAHEFAKQFGNDTENLQDLVKMLSEKSDKELIKNRIPRPVGTTELSDFVFVPCVEKEIEGVERFLHDYPYKIISEGRYNKVPVLLGYNDEEGYFFVGRADDKQSLDFFNSLPRNLNFPSDEEKRIVGNKLKELYMNGKNVSLDTLQAYSRYIGETAYIIPMISIIEEFLQTMSEPIFAYKFTYDGFLNLAKLISGFRKYPGASHGDDIFYMFKPKIPTIATASDKDVIDKVTTMWTNFAKYGDPTPQESNLLPLKWKAATKEDPKLLVINQNLTYTNLYDNDRTKFVKTLLTEYYRKS